MTRFFYAAALAALLTACGSGPHPGASNPLILPPAYGTPSAPAQGAGTGQCANQGLERFTGQLGTGATGAEMLRVSGAQTIRWVQPGQVVTMEFDPQRLTVHLAAGFVIQRAACG